VSPWRKSGPLGKNLNSWQVAEKILKQLVKVPISKLTVTEKGKLPERAGRKITGLQPQGHGRGISEVNRSFGELGELNGKAGSVPRQQAGAGKAGREPGVERAFLNPMA
jgi:hypothetical protein